MAHGLQDLHGTPDVLHHGVAGDSNAMGVSGWAAKRHTTECPAMSEGWTSRTLFHS